MIAAEQALSPWPARTQVAGWKAATLRLRKILFPGAPANPTPDCPDEIDLKASRLGMACAARIESFAPSAPQEVKDETLIRFCGYSMMQPRPLRSTTTMGLTLDFAVSGMQRPFVASGARAALAPWRRARARAVVDPDLETA